jgi:nucleotide-binding universal stress UspA family protein
MYRRILVAIDATPTEENRSALERTEQVGRLTGGEVYVLHMARSHIVPGDITAGAAPGATPSGEDAEEADRAVMQDLIDRLADAGVDAHGEMVSATEHDVAGVILQRARELDVDLLVLGHQHHRGAGNVFRASVADRIIHQHPRKLLARRKRSDARLRPTPSCVGAGYPTARAGCRRRIRIGKVMRARAPQNRNNLSKDHN